MVILAVVVQVKVCLVTVVVRAVVPVAVQNNVPVALLSLIFARGNTVPKFAVFLIHRLKLSVEPLGITPAEFGTLVWVSNSLLRVTNVKPTRALDQSAVTPNWARSSAATCQATGPAP